ncbi:hypothetical protein F2Q70_00019341 [Brassica cretica]|uniref:Thioesterase domain-containing protein n=1 Tax=Brassica cretica TaxID=69181 RepID=A0A3N6RK57_BRACR|nr:hypothetical protein F2Q70_00019341 [Brassica cretica]KAF3611181.1 hypothetical protein DY000_02044345 [Brassica cretica]
MNLELVKQYLEGDKKDEDESKVANLPPRFIERFVAKGIKVDLIEPGRIVCSMKVQPHLLEEIEIESKALRVGKAVAVVSVELRKKKDGKLIAQGRHTKYLAPRSKL